MNQPASKCAEASENSTNWTLRIQETHKPVIASCHQAGCHTSFPLTHTAVAEEVVAVHYSQLAEEELDGALAPAFLGTLALHRGETLSPLTSLWGEEGGVDQAAETK